MKAITLQEFVAFQRLMHESAGIYLSENKRSLVTGRLARRLHACGAQSYGEYYRLLTSGQLPAELQTAVDLLTTNETFFFREPKHFEFLRAQVEARHRAGGAFRVWSAATSSGEEAFSIAMVLEEMLPGRWWVVGSDISARMLAKARDARYAMDRLSNFPHRYLRRFCLKGVGARSGLLRVEWPLRERVEFRRINLNQPLPPIGTFDMVFLRNVLIYFNADTKREVVMRVAAALKPGGHLLIGHSETLSGITDALEPLAPAVYRKPA